MAVSTKHDVYDEYEYDEYEYDIEIRHDHTKVIWHSANTT